MECLGSKGTEESRDLTGLRVLRAPGGLQEHQEMQGPLGKGVMLEHREKANLDIQGSRDTLV